MNYKIIHKTNITKKAEYQEKLKSLNNNKKSGRLCQVCKHINIYLHTQNDEDKDNNNVIRGSSEHRNYR